MQKVTEGTDGEPREHVGEREQSRYYENNAVGIR